MTPAEFAMLERVADDVRDLRKTMQDNDREMRQEIADLKQTFMEHQKDPMPPGMSGVFRTFASKGKNGNGNGNGGHIKISKEQILIYIAIGTAAFGSGGTLLTQVLGG